MGMGHHFAAPTSDVLSDCFSAGLSLTLVLLGGICAGLTLAYMGQDRIYLQVIAESGGRKERQDAQKMLNILQLGKHWVLVSLLLGNVITNETLPLILDMEWKGGWVAVLTSTVLIVIFGEIIPQSLCAKHGLALGAWSSKYVLWVMYGLFPIAYPIAKLLDHVLGEDPGVVFNRSGLKALVSLHEHLNFFPTERLNREEVTVITSVLDLNDVAVSSIMTPLSKLFKLSMDASLDEATRHNILHSGYSGIPIHLPDHPIRFTGVLPVKSLVAANFEEAVTVSQMPIQELPEVRPDISVQDIFHVFRDRKVQMALVTERGAVSGEPLGIVTARDVLNELIGRGKVCL